MSIKNKWYIVVGIVIGLIVLFALPFAWQALFHSQGYGMMQQGMGFSHMRGRMSFGMPLLWIIPVSLLTLMWLSIAALIKYLRTN